MIGICGVAMAGLAAMLRERGYNVTGSDAAVYPPMSTFLAEQQIAVRSPFGPDNLKPRPDLVVVGNAISRGNAELEAVLDERIAYASMADVLRDFFIRGHQSLVVTGTHGKSTTTSLLAWTLTTTGLDPSFMVGAIPKNFNTGYRLGRGRHFLLEGDEYDTAYFDKTPKFLHYLPDVVILNNVEFDHADIYSSLEEIGLQFRRLVNLIPRRGFLAVGADSAEAVACADKAFCPVETFGLKTTADWTARNFEEKPESTRFDVIYRGQPFARIETVLRGEHNARNILAALAVGRHVGLDGRQLAEAAASFQGVRRRLEQVAKVGEIRLLDDFAHHPTAIRETIETLRRIYKGARLTVLFEPRSATTKRKVFERDFIEVFALADRVLLARIFQPEKVPEADRIDLDRVVGELVGRGQQSAVFDDLDAMADEAAGRAQPPEVIITMSNGSFGGIQQKIFERLKSR